MRFEDENLKTAFEIPDEPTYREFLRYDSAVSMRPDLETFERLWLGACALAREWKSEIIPEASSAMLDEKSSPEGMEVIKWAGLSVWSFMWDLKQIPKN